MYKQLTILKQVFKQVFSKNVGRQLKKRKHNRYFTFKSIVDRILNYYLHNYGWYLTLIFIYNCFKQF